MNDGVRASTLKFFKYSMYRTEGLGHPLEQAYEVICCCPCSICEKSALPLSESQEAKDKTSKDNVMNNSTENN